MKRSTLEKMPPVLSFSQVKHPAPWAPFSDEDFEDDDGDGAAMFQVVSVASSPTGVSEGNLGESEFPVVGDCTPTHISTGVGVGGD